MGWAMSYEEFKPLLDRLGGPIDDEWEAWHDLKRQAGVAAPQLLRQHYRNSRKWQVRVSCLYHAIAYARHFPEAVELGREALSDRSKVVRYRACMLLAVSLDKASLPALRNAESESDQDEETIGNIRAALNAIENQNQHLFVDRENSGKMTLNVELVHPEG